MLVEGEGGGAMCVESPCPAGQLPHHTSWPGEGSLVRREGDILCYPAPAPVLACTTTIVLANNNLDCSHSKT